MAILKSKLCHAVYIICCNNGGIRETVRKANGGKVLETDKKFNFEKLDYYNPPAPNYDLLKKKLRCF